MRHIRESTVAGRWHRISLLVYPRLVLFCGFCETVYLLNKFERLWHIDASLSGQWADKPDPFIFYSTLERCTYLRYCDAISWPSIFYVKIFVTSSTVLVQTLIPIALWVFALSLLSTSLPLLEIPVCWCSSCSCLLLMLFNVELWVQIVDYWLCKCIFTL